MAVPSRSPGETSKNRGKNAIGRASGHQALAIQKHLFPVKEVEVDGVAMGVLSDGTPYLHLRGLARLAGIDHTALLRLSNNWADEQRKPRGAKIKELLLAQGHPADELNLVGADCGVDTHVYTDAACMAVLEYYAFDSEQGANDTALKNYRLLARQSFRLFIYKKCGYDPDRHIPQSWRNFHERLLINDQLPLGYFSVFRELAELVVHMIKAGCPFDDHTVPDISVGITWGRHWEASLFDARYGMRKKHPHDYPEWYPQSAANPINAWIYPVGALGEFHTWLYKNYIPKAFPKYVNGKVKSGVFLPARAEQLMVSLERPVFPAP